MENLPRRKRVVIQASPPIYSKEQKAGFVLVGVSGGLALLLGVFFLIKHVTLPFDQSYFGPRFLTPRERQERELITQKQTDTDGDGLSDYDELYVHRTSPYLSDTDGDGYSDKMEIDAGEDPNCKAGDTCEVMDGGVAASDSQTPNGPSTAEIINDISGLTPSDIRQLLITAGVSESEVNALTDEQVQTLYRQVLQEMEQSGEIDQIIQGQ